MVYETVLVKYGVVQPNIALLCKLVILTTNEWEHPFSRLSSLYKSSIGQLNSLVPHSYDY